MGEGVQRLDRAARRLGLRHFHRNLCHRCGALLSGVAPHHRRWPGVRSLRGFAVVSAGATLGAALAFLVARYFLRHRVEEAAKNNPKFAAMDEAIGREGWKMVALLRLSPLVPFNLSNYLYGVTKIGFWPYVAASWAGMLPGTFLYVYIGAAGKEATSGEAAGPWKWALFGAGLAATIVVTVWISRVAKKAVPGKK